jgi:hypothetical protein
MPEQSLDDRGRVTIEKDLRPFLGKRFVQILMPDGIHLVPLTGRVEWGNTPSDLATNAKRIFREEMDKEIDEELRTIHGLTPDLKPIRGWKPDGKRRRKPAHRVRKSK